jgi:hypothetical protein
MALGAGGRMRQKIYPDRHGRDVWDTANFGRAELRLANSRRWREISGLEPPPTPIDTAAYTAAGLPWFDLYDEGESTVAPGGTQRIATIAERDRELGDNAGDRPVDVPVIQITGIHRHE